MTDGRYADPDLHRNGSSSSQIGYLNQTSSSANNSMNGDYVRAPSSTAHSMTSNDLYQQYNPQDEKGLYPDAGLSNLERHPSDMLRSLANYNPQGPLELHGEEEMVEDEYWEDEEDEDESRFINFSLLSHMAVQLRDKVPRGTHVKGSIPYPRAFTGKDIVVRIENISTSTGINRQRSQQSSHRSNANLLLITASQRAIDAQHCKLREVYKASYSFTRWNGEAECCRMVSKTFTCFWMIKKVDQIIYQSGKNYPPG